MGSGLRAPGSGLHICIRWRMFVWVIMFTSVTIKFNFNKIFKTQYNATSMFFVSYAHLGSLGSGLWAPHMHKMGYVSVGNDVYKCNNQI